MVTGAQCAPAVFIKKKLRVFKQCHYERSEESQFNFRYLLRELFAQEFVNNLG